ncbi:MAG: M55 family metallopeptidase [Candidatus Thorarchaeota archaeon]
MPKKKSAGGKETLKVVIVNDLEGISGIDHWHQLLHGFEEFEEVGRTEVTEDVNAAIRGLRAAGATEIRVADSHGSGGPNKNIIPERLEEGVKLYQEQSIPDRMTEAVDETVDAAVLIGFHAMADTKDGLFRHTITIGPRIEVNGRPVGETALDAYILAEYGIPVIMATGDQALVREALEFLPGIETVQVKTSTDSKTTDCLPLSEARKLIEEAAERALSKLDEFSPVQVSKPVRIDVTFPKKEQVVLCENIPGAEKSAEMTISYTADEWDEAYKFIRTCVGFAGQFLNSKLVEKLRALPGSESAVSEWAEEIVEEWLT